MRKFSRRLLMVVLTCAMVFGLSGMTAFATEVGEQDAAAEPVAISEAEGTAEEAAVPLAEATEYEPNYCWYSGEGAGTYTITSAAQLAGLSEIVNGTADGIDQYSFKEQTIKLEVEDGYLDMNADNPVSWSAPNTNGVVEITTDVEGARAFTPIGTEKDPFEGTFEGNGVTIKNLYVTGDEGYLGLFGVVGTKKATEEGCYGTVRNFTLTGVVQCSGGDSNEQMDYVGGAVGKLNAGGTVEYVTNKDLLVDAPGTDNVGGIVGFAGTPTRDGYDDNPSVSNTQVLCCENDATVRAYYKVGGIVGENAATVKYCCNKGWIMCRRNYGQGAGVGGIVGRNGNNNDADEEALVAFCYNTGMITNNGRNDDSASNTIRGYAGICGTTYGATGKVETHNCYNIGAIPEGYGQYNSITNYIEDGANVAVRDNYSLNDKNLIHNAGTSVQETGSPVTEANFKVTSRNSGDILYDLGAYFVADTTGKYNDGYPILFWETGDKTVPTITDLKITQQPDKTTYNGEAFDPTGMVVTATYSNGAKMEIQPAYATYEETTYTLSDCYTYDYTKVLTAGDDHIDITFDGITEPVPINDGEKKDYIPVITSTGEKYQLKYSDVREAGEAAGESTITDGNSARHRGEFVLVSDLLKKYLDIDESDYDEFSIINSDGDSVIVPGEIYTKNSPCYMCYDEYSDCCYIAGNYVDFEYWYDVSEIDVTLHDWRKVVWDWSKDYTSAMASRTCNICNKKEEATVDITTDVIEPGYRTAGKTTYTATATFPDGTIATDIQETDLKAASGYIDVAINRVGEKTETGKLLYSDINEAMAKRAPRTFTYTHSDDPEEKISVTDRFVPIAELLDITDTIDDACYYYVKYDEGEDDGVYLPTSACIYCRADTLTYRTAVDGSVGRMWVDSPISIEVNYQHDWGDLTWDWDLNRCIASVKGKCQMDVCEHEEEVDAEVITKTNGIETTYIATATFSDGTVVTDTVVD